MKYYVYISDTKVDMLYSQIPEPILRRISTEISLDLPLVSASLKKTPSDETRYSKLRIVVDYLHNHQRHLLGSLKEPRAYVYGTCPMIWHCMGGKHVPYRPTVYFHGHTQNAIAAFAGSSRFLIGRAAGLQQDLDDCAVMPSELRSVLAALRSADSLDEPEELSDVMSWRANSVWFGVSNADTHLGPWVPWDTRQRMEFLARHFRTCSPAEAERLGCDPQYTMILGSPIFVAYADPE